MIFKTKRKNDVRTVLFVDDDNAILRSLEFGLLDVSYNMLFANSCKKALEILNQEEVHVIVTDIRMPEIDGHEFIKIIQEKYPDIVKIVLSAYCNDDALQKTFEQNEIFEVVSKPWELRGNFEKLILRAFEHYGHQGENESAKQHD